MWTEGGNQREGRKKCWVSNSKRGKLTRHQWKRLGNIDPNASKDRKTQKEGGDFKEKSARILLGTRAPNGHPDLSTQSSPE